MKIGLFDSGLGGLTILRAVAKELPAHDFFYYGDTANLPYGDKTEAEIYAFSVVAMDYLFDHGCSLIIIACNTASAETLRKLQDEYVPARYPDRRILGVIIPTIEELVDRNIREALLLATARTVESKKYDRELEKRGSPLILHSIATPGLVPLIEVGKVDEAAGLATQIITGALERNPALKTVVLGCTHYTELKEKLRNHFAGRLVFISQDEVIPRKLSAYLVAHPELEVGEPAAGKRVIHLTEHRPDYDRVIAQLLGGVFVSEE
ncbi:glutamate racemase [Patescibacteria group bacterium]|nr:glutamate racemase [Patescibacteria group bacterium]